MILLDTHAWLWWLNGPGLLSERATAAIDQARSGAIAVSAISVWETAMLVKKGRLQLSLEVSGLVSRCKGLPFLKFVPVDPAIALQAVELDPFHADPADRMIVATALKLRVPLVTKDERIRESGAVETIW